MTKWIHRIAAACLAAAGPAHAELPASSMATPMPPCVATDAYAPICGLHAPEDLDTLDDSRLLVVQMRGMTGKGESNFATLDPGNRGRAGAPVSGGCSPACLG